MHQYCTARSERPFPTNAQAREHHVNWDHFHLVIETGIDCDQSCTCISTVPCFARSGMYGDMYRYMYSTSVIRFLSAFRAPQRHHRAAALAPWHQHYPRHVPASWGLCNCLSSPSEDTPGYLLHDKPPTLASMDTFFGLRSDRDRLQDQPSYITPAGSRHIDLLFF